MPSTSTTKSSPSASPLASVQQLADQARFWWESAPTPTRVISIGLAILVALCLCGAVMLATAPQYEDLFTNLDPHDTAAIAAKLDDAHEKYQIAEGETAILVPSGDKDRLRMEMIRDGLPAKTGGVVGSDWLDKIGMGTTSDVQNQYINMANQGELSQTISSMNEIASADVHLSPGSNTPFADNDTPPSASVVVGIKQGMSLTPDQIQGIANLVAKAVPGLDLKNVAVVDTDGNQLWNGSQAGGSGGLDSSGMDAGAQFADSMRKEIQSHLDFILGQRKAIVSVHAEMNFDQVHSDATTFQKGPLLSAQTNDEKYEGSGGQQGASAAGIASNTPGGSVPQYGAATGGGGGKSGTYDNSGETDNYSNSHTETVTDKAPGAIQRLAVAVLVDSSVPQAAVAALQTYCATVAGVTPGDSSRVVTVQSIAFSSADFKSQQALVTSAQSQARMQEILKIVAVAIVAVVLLMIFLRSNKAGASLSTSGTRRGELESRSQFRFSQDEDEDLDSLGSSQSSAHLEAGAGGASSGRPRLSGAQSSEHGAAAVSDEPMSIEAILGDMPAQPTRQKRRQREIPEIEQQMDMKLESIRDMVNQQPKSVALLMKGWMTDVVDSD